MELNLNVIFTVTYLTNLKVETDTFTSEVAALARVREIERATGSVLLTHSVNIDLSKNDRH